MTTLRPLHWRDIRYNRAAKRPRGQESIESDVVRGELRGIIITTTVKRKVSLILGFFFYFHFFWYPPPSSSLLCLLRHARLRHPPLQRQEASNDFRVDFGTKLEGVQHQIAGAHGSAREGVWLSTAFSGWEEKVTTRAASHSLSMRPSTV